MVSVADFLGEKYSWKCATFCTKGKELKTLMIWSLDKQSNKDSTAADITEDVNNKAVRVFIILSLASGSGGHSAMVH